MLTLAQGRSLHTVNAGDVIFRPGDRGDCLYGVVEGSVKLSWADNNLFEIIEAGSSFGIGALVDPEHRRYGTAIAQTDGQILVMGREEFLLAVQELPMFGLEMLHDLDQRLRTLKARCQQLRPPV